MHTDVERSSEHIAVCICTRERPQMLERIIRSYAQLHHPAGVAVSLVIIENDSAPACEGVVRQLATELGIEVHYCHEPRLGIPCARNRALDEAQSLGASHLAFADDDEWFQPDWLLAFWRCRETLGQDAVLQGPVVSVLPPGVPEYYAAFYYTGRHPTGTALEKCATNNVLMPLDLICRHGLRFDESRPLAGGEDTIFFRQAYRAGVAMLACEEAVIYEEVVADRTSVSWLIKRNFRIGATWGNYQTEQLRRNRLTAALSQLPKLVLRAVKVLLFTVTFRPKKGLASILEVARISGRILGCFGVQISAYKQVDV